MIPSFLPSFLFGKKEWGGFTFSPNSSAQLGLSLSKITVKDTSGCSENGHFAHSLLLVRP
jgi:hypothetical protein